jgi:hypothetical protein
MRLSSRKADNIVTRGTVRLNPGLCWLRIVITGSMSSRTMEPGILRIADS